MKNILVIPHSSLDNIVIRSEEIAKILAKDNKVYYLKWYRRKSDNIFPKIFEVLFNAIRKESIEREMDTRIYQIIRRKYYYPFKIALYLNSKVINSIINEYNIDVVFNASIYFYPVSKKPSLVYIYDVVDDHFRGHPGNFSFRMSNRIKSFIEYEINKADFVLSVTQSLKKYINTHYGISAIWSSNGANVKLFRSVTKEMINNYRDSNNLKNKFVIGFIGNLRDSYTGLDFLLSFFKLAYSENNNMCMLLVGPTSNEQRKVIVNTPGVIYKGHLPPDQMPLIFNVINVGILPFDKTPFTDHALPIKIIEYGAAKKYVISSNLIGVQEINLPYIHIVNREENLWLKTLKHIMNLSWKTSYDEEIDKFEWERISKDILNLLIKK